MQNGEKPANLAFDLLGHLQCRAPGASAPPGCIDPACGELSQVLDTTTAYFEIDEGAGNSADLGGLSPYRFKVLYEHQQSFHRPTIGELVIPSMLLAMSASRLR